MMLKMMMMMMMMMIMTTTTTTMTMMIIMNKKSKWEAVRGLAFIRGTIDNLLFRKIRCFARSSFAAGDIICDR